MVLLGTGCSSVGNGVYLSGSVRDGVQLNEGWSLALLFLELISMRDVLYVV